jgi:hypothetical protein
MVNINIDLFNSLSNWQPHTLFLLLLCFLPHPRSPSHQLDSMSTHLTLWRSIAIAMKILYCRNSFSLQKNFHCDVYLSPPKQICCTFFTMIGMLWDFWSSRQRSEAETRVSRIKSRCGSTRSIVDSVLNFNRLLPLIYMRRLAFLCN